MNEYIYALLVITWIGLYLHFYFAGEEVSNAIRIIKSFYIPAGVILFIIDTFLTAKVSFRNSGLIFIISCLLSMFIFKLSIIYKESPNEKWYKYFLIENQLLSFFGMPYLLIPMLFVLAIFNIVKRY